MLVKAGAAERRIPPVATALPSEVEGEDIGV